MPNPSLTPITFKKHGFSVLVTAGTFKKNNILRFAKVASFQSSSVLVCDLNQGSWESKVNPKATCPTPQEIRPQSRDYCIKIMVVK